MLSNRGLRRCVPVLTSAAMMAVVLAAPATRAPASSRGLAVQRKKEIAMELVSSAENSSLNWRGQYGYIQDIGDGRGYTAGIIGFCSGTGDMLVVVRMFTRLRPHNSLVRFLPALRRVNGTPSHRGLGPKFVAAWKRAASNPALRSAQRTVRDLEYFNPAVALAESDGLRALGQFAYYDATVVHGFDGLRAIRARAITHAEPPSSGGDEVTYLSAFLDERDVEMKKEAAHGDLSRIESEQRKFLADGNLDLNPPLRWSTYGDRYAILH